MTRCLQTTYNIIWAVWWLIRVAFHSLSDRLNREFVVRVDLDFLKEEQSGPTVAQENISKTACGGRLLVLVIEVDSDLEE